MSVHNFEAEFEAWAASNPSTTINIGSTSITTTGSAIYSTGNISLTGDNSSLRLVGTDSQVLLSGTGSQIDLAGIADSLVLDADSDTTISAPTDDQIDIEVGGADIMTIKATGPKVKVGTAHIGYETGAGGAVTQITDATTGVTLSKPCGQITTVALTTAAAAEERFTVTNTLVAATDCIVLSTTYDGAGTPVLAVQKVAAGAFDIVITNVHAANAFNAVMVINFALIKAVAA